MVQARLFPERLVGALLALFVLTPAASAQADAPGWTLCNETSFVIEAATARAEGQSVVVEGWTKLRPGSCALTVTGTLTPGYHYIYARSSAAHRGGARKWGGDIPLCVDPTGSFSVENPPTCAEFGLEERQFRPVLIERRTRWQTTLTETTDYTMETARAAGVQRLLEDAGIFSGRVDGLLGRKTRIAIGEFLTQKNLSSDISDEDLIDILEQSAIERANEVGLTLCNRTDKRIWGAVARRRGEDWESRGWWLLEAGGCARAIDEPLIQTDHFIYGEMEDGGATRRLVRGSDGFCVTRSKFAIAGREACEEGSYRTELFSPAPQPAEGRLVFEFFERDFAQARNDG